MFRKDGTTPNFTVNLMFVAILLTLGAAGIVANWGYHHTDNRMVFNKPVGTVAKVERHGSVIRLVNNTESIRCSAVGCAHIKPGQKIKFTECAKLYKTDHGQVSCTEFERVGK